MNLKEAISWAKSRAKAYSHEAIFYVCKWNDGYCLYSYIEVKRHPEIKEEAVYNTKTDKIKNKNMFQAICPKCNDILELDNTNIVLHKAIFQHKDCKKKGKSTIRVVVNGVEIG